MSARNAFAAHPRRIAIVVAILTLAGLAALVALSSTALLPLAPSARALPPAGTDTLKVTAEVSLISRMGEETIALSGTVDIQRDDPRTEEGVEVVDVEIVSLDLEGEGLAGPVMVSQSETLASTGEIRSLQPPPDQFPASSFLDVFIVAQIPGWQYPPTVHNEQPLRMVAAPDIAAWPPGGALYSWETTYGVDDDGDTLIDEDTADDDGDGVMDEDPINSRNEDNDTQFDEDPPLSQCTLELCDNDGDTVIDEDPSCSPLVSPGGSHLKAGFCITGISILVPPIITPFPTASPTGTAGTTPTPTGTAAATPGTTATTTPTPTSSPTSPPPATVAPTGTNTPTPTDPAMPTSTPSPTPALTPTAPSVLVGDVSCDGTVNAIDAALILQFDVGLLASLDCRQHADVNLDGTVNAIDAALILQFDAGLIPSLPP